MTKGRYYSLSEIENFGIKNHYKIKELGKELVGQKFIILYNEALDITISFVLADAGGVDYSYLCVYNY